MSHFIVSWLDVEDGEILAEEVVEAESRLAVISSALDDWVSGEQRLSGAVLFLRMMGQEPAISEEAAQDAPEDEIRVLADMVLEVISDDAHAEDLFLRYVADSMTIARETVGPSPGGGGGGYIGQPMDVE